jgi:hypothetical protein
MIVEHLMLLVLLFLIDLAVLLSFGAQVRLARTFRTHRAQRDHFLQLLGMTRRAFGLRRRGQHQVLKLMLTFFALVFVNRHSADSNIRRRN